MLVHDEVRDALADGRAVVALESTIISHGLPRPDNARLAREFEQAVRDGGAVPATVAVIDGQARIGLDDAALDRLANDEDATKVSVRELAAIAARGGVGSTTVASTAHLAAAAGITVFATGGLGGVHRGAQDTFDESADLTTLSRTGVLVVCAGVKSILDVGATLERLETLGRRRARLPHRPLPRLLPRRLRPRHRLAGRVGPTRSQRSWPPATRVGTTGLGLILANPISADDELDRDLHDRLLESGLAAADRDGVHGKDVTPYLLDWFHRESDGASLRANVALVRSNARLAAEVATAYAAEVERRDVLLPRRPDGRRRRAAVRSAGRGVRQPGSHLVRRGRLGREHRGLADPRRRRLGLHRRDRRRRGRPVAAREPAPARGRRAVPRRPHPPDRHLPGARRADGGADDGPRPWCQPGAAGVRRTDRRVRAR